MSGFPINLDLSEYFDDLRKYSSIFVNLSKCKDVRDVGNHIKSVFGLEDNICLVHKKFLIPKSEDIQILQQYDIFKVQKCNFYDLQIHKTKKVNNNSIGDQKALNLTQSEKTIDLSCRPKQRLKASICPSPGVSGTLTLNVDNKTCTDSQIVSSERSISLNGSHNIPKDKSKHKKKRYLQSDESDDDAGNILDMSVKNSKGNKHSNGLSTDEGSLLSEGLDDVYCTGSTKDLHKRPKKRKKHSDEVVDANLDLASTSWNTLVCDDASFKEQNSKKKSKKGRDDCSNESLSNDTNKASAQNGIEKIIDFDYDHPIDDECSVRRKHKHNKKHGESKELHDPEGNQYYSSTGSPLCTSKNNNLKKTSTPKTFCHSKHEKHSDSSKPLEEQKKRITVGIDQMISEIHKNSSDTNSQTDGDGNKSMSYKQPTSENNLQENYEESGIEENITQESCTDLDFTNTKRKRKRKHNKKKNREKLLYMLAVGPTMNQLAAQPTVAKSSPSSEISKHVFFTEEDFVEDMTVPSTPPVNSQTLKDQPLTSHAEVASSQQQSSSKPTTWQDQLLQLASSSSKPVVFYRNSSVTTTNKPISSTQEIVTPALNSNHTGQNTSDRPVQVNPVAEDSQRCNVEVMNDINNEDQSCSGTVEGHSQRKGLPDICKPLPVMNVLQNINLSDYPIIDKVVAQDLILFKVLKLNENCEQGVSKPILATVNGTTNFPDRISLQIMEGCEECSHCTQSEQAAGAFNIELRWVDILEPRLFYP